MKKTGIYITFPKSNNKQSIYKAKNYKTKVNNECTKVGIVETTFDSREKSYADNFGDIVFEKIAFVDKVYLKDIERLFLAEIKKEFKTVGRSREWFHTTNRERLIEIIRQVLDQSNIPCDVVF